MGVGIKGVSKWGAGSFAEVSPSVGVEVEVTQYTSEAYRLKAHVIGIVGFSYGFVQGAESLNRVSSKGGIDMRLQLETRDGSCFSSKFTAGDLSGVGAAINIEITR